MTEDLQPGQHLSPDQLSAFAENALPEHERLSALAHLADCPDCRRVVFLIQQADTALAVSKPTVETPRRAWFTLPQIFVAATAALACSLILALIVHHQLGQASSPPSVTTAQLQPQPAIVPPPLPAPAAPSPAPAKLSSAATHSSRAEILDVPPPPKPAQVRMAPSPRALGASGYGTGASYADESRMQDSAQDKMKSAQQFTTDSNASASTVAALPPKVPMQFDSGMPNPAPAAPSTLAETHARQAYSTTTAAKDFPASTAAVPAPPPPPPPSSSAETVTVNADGASMQTETPTLSGRAVQNNAALMPGVAPPINLPSKKPVAVQLNAGSRTLALDNTGALFLTYDQGKHWTSVKTQWSGKAVQLSFATTPSRLYQVQPSQTQTQTQQTSVPISGFELTTATGAVWLSSDGLTWRAR